jgi:hypothetical protein
LANLILQEFFQWCNKQLKNAGVLFLNPNCIGNIPCGGLDIAVNKDITNPLKINSNKKLKLHLTDSLSVTNKKILLPAILDELFRLTGKYHSLFVK